MIKLIAYITCLLKHGSYRGKWEWKHRAEPNNRAKWRRMCRELYGSPGGFTR